MTNDYCVGDIQTDGCQRRTGNVGSFDKINKIEWTQNNKEDAKGKRRLGETFQLVCRTLQGILL